MSKFRQNGAFIRAKCLSKEEETPEQSFIINIDITKLFYTSYDFPITIYTPNLRVGWFSFSMAEIYSKS